MIGVSAARALAAFLACIFALTAATAMAATAESTAPAQVRETEAGMVLTTLTGMTLYTYRLDEATPGKSRCTNTRYTMQNGRQFGQVPLPAAQTRKTCADKRPPFLAAADASPAGDWSLIDRGGGVKQWAFKGSPLYTSIKDRKPGDVNGEGGVANFTVWGAALAPLDFPPGFKLSRREEGLVLTASDGRPAYVRRGARLQRASAGSPQLLQPIIAPSFGKASGKWTIADLGGVKQYAYDGEPLYVLPEGYTDADAEQEGGWATAVFRRARAVPAQFGTRTTLVGKVYTTDKGMTLYSFTCTETEVPDFLPCDDPGDAAAYWSALCGDAKECSRRWRPYRPAADARPSGEFSIIEVSDPPFLDPAGSTAPPETPRVKVWAYRGRPLYTFVDDDEPGQTLGDWINYFSRSWFDAVLVPGPGIY